MSPLRLNSNSLTVVELVSIPSTCAVLAVLKILNTFHSFDRVNNLILRFVLQTTRVSASDTFLD